MQWIADLHIHSKYSRATSRDCDAPHLDLWARRKGIQLVGTGDFTHPQWRTELKELLDAEESGIYRLKSEYRLPDSTKTAQDPRFIVTGEISTIYKKDGKTRKVHHLVALPGLQEADRLAHRLEAIGNIHSDGRPILGLDSRDLLEIILDCCPNAIYFPAHIWTPHFSLFGAFSGFDTIEECFGDLTPYVHAMETGLSSDPPMNRLLSMLDGHELVSNSDAHSPAKLGREANLLSCDLRYEALKTALDTGDGLDGTIEFYPEEGKYHLDGHRACHVCLMPEETAQYDGRCPVCGKKITVGVLSRVEALADRKTPEHMDKPFESLVPLPELIGETLGVSAESKRAQAMYFDLLERLGPEFSILRDLPIDDIERAGGFLLGEAVKRAREGNVIRQGGYDGEYGVIRVFQPGEKETLLGQTTLLAMPAKEEKEGAKKREKEKNAAVKEAMESNSQFSPNPEQDAAIRAKSDTIVVIAGPGTGKTGTLIRRIEYLLTEKQVSPKEITAVTFTRQAAGEITQRLENSLGKKAVRGLKVGTFHSICLGLIDNKPIISRTDAIKIIAGLLKERKENLSAANALALISAKKNALEPAGLPHGLMEQYQERLGEMRLRDLDDILLDALNAPDKNNPMFHYLLVDEYQDINGLQRKLVLKWSDGGKLFVIGDPDQSIYGFRGANAACFDELVRLRPDARIIHLVQNYRSTPEILDCALSVIGNNPGGKRELKALSPSHIPPRFITAADEITQGIWIAKEIAALTGGVDMLEASAGERPKYAFSEIAVLCRTHRQLETIESCLRHDSIPCVVSGREAALETDRNQSLISFFRMMEEPDHPIAVHQALKGLWHCPDGLIQRVEAQARVPGGPGSEAFAEALTSYDALSPFLEAVNELYPMLQKASPRDLLERLANLTGGVKKDTECLLNTSVFFDGMKAFLANMLSGEEGDIRRLSGGKASGAVRLMTLHAAKGLEFPIVFLAGVDEGELPLSRVGEAVNDEEERRLFYVGITRARQELILSSAGKPSPFLMELPDSVSRETVKGFTKRPSYRQLSLFDTP